MAKKDPPLSSQNRDRVEESAPRGKTPMERFKSLGAKIVQVPYEEVRKAEKRERQRKKD